MTAKKGSTRDREAVLPGMPFSRARAEYYLASYPPDKAELYFALRIPDGVPDLDDEITATAALRDRLRAAPENPSAVFDALRALDLGALWITEDWETDPMALESDCFRRLHELREDIRHCARKNVGRWHKASIGALAPHARADAAKQLKHLGALLAGDRRGKHGRLARPFTVQRLYAEQLFRLVLFLRELTALDRRRITKAEVLQLRDKHRVAPEIINDNYHFNEDGVLGRRLSARHALSAVRNHVAVECGLEPATVSTILSRASVKVLRK